MLLCIRSVNIEIFGLHELILYVAEDYFLVLLCIHSVDIGMFGPHELILYVIEDYFSALLCIHSVDIEMFDLHELTDLICLWSERFRVALYSQCGQVNV